MNYRAKGTFEVSMQPLSETDTTVGAKLARMSLDKKFSGDLVGTGQGEMLSAVTDVKGFPTEAFKIKRTAVQAIYPVKIRTVKD